MKKIILSVAAAAMALTTTAAALEDIKVNGQAKLWYETNNQQQNDLFSGKMKAPGTDNNASTSADGFGTSGEVVFKLAVTGKQGNVGFGATFYQTSTMGLENNVVVGARTQSNGVTAGSGELYTGEMYITVPTVASTTLKIGKQELQTPFAFTEKWNATPNTFNAAVAINKSIENLTLVAAYVGQGGTNTTTWMTNGEVINSFYEGAYAAVAHYKTNDFDTNVYLYDVTAVADAYWVDASTTLSGVKVAGIIAGMNPKGKMAARDDTRGYAISASTDVSGINLMGAYSVVNDVDVGKTGLPLANTATGFKKSMLPTEGVYTDGLYVAQADSNAFKLKASGKIADIGVALQYIDNSNKTTKSLETQEIDLILSKKLGDVNMKAILMDRSFDDATTDKDLGAQHVRIIASVDF
jgi:hypothetical protein